MTDVLLGYEPVPPTTRSTADISAPASAATATVSPGAAFCAERPAAIHLTANEGKNQLHGGLCGFDKKLWNYTCREDSVEFTTVLADGEEGFPGRMEVVHHLYARRTKTALHIDYRAVSAPRIPSPTLRTTPTLTSTATAAATCLGHTAAAAAPPPITPADAAHACRPARSPPWTAPAWISAPRRRSAAASMMPLLEALRRLRQQLLPGRQRPAQGRRGRGRQVRHRDGRRDDARGRAALHRQLPVRPHRQGRRALRRPSAASASRRSTIPTRSISPRSPRRSCASGEQLHETTIYRFGVRK